MKIRYGFVTNSSSSSFILAFNNKDEIGKLNLSERAMELLNDEENERSLEEVLDEYREYCDGELYYYMDHKIHDRMGIPYGLTHEQMMKLATERKDEYDKVYQKVYNEYCEQKVQNLKEKLSDNKHLLVINEGDEYSSYEELYHMKEVVAIMDYH